MRSLFCRNILVPAFALLALTLSAGASFADTPWLPSQEFKPDTRVYLDKKLSQHPTYPVQLNGLSGELDKLSKEQGVQFYFVFAEKVDATVPPQYKNMYAEWQLDELINRVQGNPAFQAKNTVVLLLVRSNKNPNAFAWAGNAGSELRAQHGMTPQYFTT